MENAKSVFDQLNAIDVSGHVEKKNGLSFLSWVWAWSELVRRFPDANFRVIPDPEGLNYHSDGRTAWVEVGVTVQGREIVETLPVMDYRNQSIPRDRLTSMDVNKAIKRCLTKAIALHGLGLYIYAGEDLPENAVPYVAPPVEEKPDPKDAVASFVCTSCGELIKPVTYKGEEYPVRRVAHISTETYGRPLCWECMKQAKKDRAEMMPDKNAE